MKKHLVALLAMAFAAVGLTVVTAPAANAVGCVGESCYNKGPVSMGCTKDQRAIAIDPQTNYTYVYYSPACQAVWAISFAAPTIGYPCHTVSLERARSNLIVQGRLTQQFCPGEKSEWTNMFPKGWYFRAIDDEGPGYNTWYTPWVFR
ncbi:hypothetical protein GCM10009804_53020 [Kribbella hippodromi]|uniref:DUF2690 domain-containing protein n=1 Tax=Kribbella hippodromi TaxID=434347 RepID=A0ABN2DYM2_9ACTN